ncbi:MAG: hypothetical protein FWF76_04655 [Oscillospiraceae bacterium]|nr:hypothetical protein [Oscillospiraceae bacterium]
MKPVLIDRSLVNVDFLKISRKLDDNDSLSKCEMDEMEMLIKSDELTEKKALFAYVCALMETGVSYIELDFSTLIRLPKPSGSEKYIYRINEPEEYVVANALNFSYAVLPLKYARLRSQLELPIILEIDVGDATEAMTVFNILQIISTNIDLTEYAMLRLIGEFDSESVRAIIHTYRRRSIIPLDICPRNTVLTALDSAVTAYRCDCDAITVSFAEPAGGGATFAALEETLITLASMYRIVVSPTYLEGICKATLFSAMFAKRNQTNLTLLMNKYMHSPLTILRADSDSKDTPDSHNENTSYECTKARMPEVKPVYSNNTKVVEALQLDYDTSRELIRVLNSCNMELYNENSDDVLDKSSKKDDRNGEK